MEFDAITIDTQVIEHNSFNFDGGLLAQLKQFKNGPTQVIISLAILREVSGHLREKIRVTRDSIEGHHRQAILYGMRARDEVAFPKPIDPRTLSLSLLKGYLDAIGAKVIPFDDVSIKDLMTMYFRGDAPFGTANKKAEFPDAIAILSLEKWAKEHDQKILAVSADGDWLKYSSDRITVVKDLATALSLLQNGTTKAEMLVTKLIEDMRQKGSSLRDEFNEQLTSAIENYDIPATGAGSAHLELESVTTKLVSFEFPDTSDDFKLIQVGRQKIVAEISIYATVNATAKFSVAIWDSVDKEYIPMGSMAATVDNDQLELTVLVEFVGDWETTWNEIRSVEIVSSEGEIDFGYIEPDFSDEDEPVW